MHAQAVAQIPVADGPALHVLGIRDFLFVVLDWSVSNQDRRTGSHRRTTIRPGLMSSTRPSSPFATKCSSC